MIRGEGVEPKLKEKVNIDNLQLESSEEICSFNCPKRYVKTQEYTLTFFGFLRLEVIHFSNWVTSVFCRFIKCFD